MYGPKVIGFGANYLPVILCRPGNIVVASLKANAHKNAFGLTDRQVLCLLARLSLAGARPRCGLFISIRRAECALLELLSGKAECSAFWPSGTLRAATSQLRCTLTHTHKQIVAETDSLSLVGNDCTTTHKREWQSSSFLRQHAAYE